jgi:hypothetical protein
MQGYYEFKSRPRPKDRAMFFPSIIPSSDEQILFTVTLLTKINGEDEKIMHTIESYEIKEFED